jgi:hypothetical protein
VSTSDKQDVPLLGWRPPACRVIPFPTGRRIGAARKVAEQLSKARTTDEADRALNRAGTTMYKQMRKAGIPDEEFRRQLEAFLRTIYAECMRVKSKWAPALPEQGLQHRQPEA